jgi:GDP-L-fucose synthase
MKILLTGGSGMLGQAILRCASPALQIIAPTRDVLDCADERAVCEYFAAHRFDCVIHSAAKVGGIQANMTDQAGFLTQNMRISLNVIEAARAVKVPKLVFFGSSCMYPKDLGRVLREDDVLSAPLEPTNEGYALAKIAGTRLCQYVSEQDGLAYRCFIPCNLYGPGDCYDPARSHLLAAIIAKLHAGDGTIWGDGTARREFVYVDDLARFVLGSLDQLEDMPALLNLGAGVDYSVTEYYQMVADVIGYSGEFTHDASRPAGMQAKLMDCTQAREFGWAPQTSLKDGVAAAYQDFMTRPSNAGSIPSGSSARKVS